MLGPLGYALICAFSYVQIGYMIRGKTNELGRLPLYSLVLGLGILQVSLWQDRSFVPLYVTVGNAASLVGGVVTLALTYRTSQYRVLRVKNMPPRIVDVHGELES